MEFPLSEEKEGGHQPELYELLKSGLKDEEMVDRFFDRIISVYRCPEKYLILLVHGVYDIPGRTSDGIGMYDASTDVYEFMELSICPVKLLRDGLCYDAGEKAFFSRTEDWAVQKPEVGLLYPAFNERSTDIHAALWYAKNDECRHEELTEELLGFDPPRGQSSERDLFREVIEVSLGGEYDYDSVVKINDAVNRMVEDGKDAGETDRYAQAGCAHRGGGADRDESDRRTGIFPDTCDGRCDSKRDPDPAEKGRAVRKKQG